MKRANEKGIGCSNFGGAFTLKVDIPELQHFISRLPRH